MKKSRLRQLMRTRLEALNAPDRSLASQKACRHLADASVWSRTSTILVFLSRNDEMDTAPVISLALDDHKHLYAPRINGDKMIFLHITSESGPFEIQNGIRVPPSSAQRWTPFSGPDLVLVPGLAFDLSGGRLGRGRGYYDRLISLVRQSTGTARKRTPRFFGFAHSLQVVEGLELDDHDERVDGLVTDAGVRVF